MVSVPRGQVIELFHCAICNNPSMRVWAIKYFDKDLTACSGCIEEAARRGGMVDVTELGGAKAYIPGQDIHVHETNDVRHSE